MCCRLTPPEPDFAQRPPWVPRTLELALERRDLAERWAYVVVDEIVDSQVGLAISPWPRLDPEGRLLFADPERDQLVGVSLDRFRALLDGNRYLLLIAPAGHRPDRDTAAALAGREVRIGDVFAVPRPAEGGWTRSGAGGETELAAAEDPVFDITFEAREAAKLAGAAAVAPALSEDEARRYLDEEGEGGEEPEGDGPGGGAGGPPRRPEPSGISPGGEAIPAGRLAEVDAHA